MGFFLTFLMTNLSCGRNLCSCSAFLWCSVFFLRTTLLPLVPSPKNGNISNAPGSKVLLFSSFAS